MWRLWPVLLCAALAGLALADEVKKKDGTIIEGEIVSEDAESVTIRAKHGEARIARSDVASITKKPLANPKPAAAKAKTIDEGLDRIRASTVDQLKALLKDAEAQANGEAAAAIQSMIASVSTWSTRDYFFAAGAGRAELRELRVQWNQLQANRSLTSVQMESEVKRFKAAVDGKKILLSGRIDNVSVPYGRPWVVVDYLDADQERCQAWFKDPKDVETLKAAQRGAEMAFETKLSLDHTGFVSSELVIGDAVLRALR